MSIDVQKVIQVYDNCLTLLQAKKNLFVESQQLNIVFQRFNLIRNQEQNLYLQYIQDGILKIMKTWLKKFNIYEQFADYHKHTLAQLQFKAQNLKNNNEILSKQDQIINEIQGIIRGWRQNMTPAEYYNNKYKKTIKMETQQKLQLLKSIQSKPFHSISPLYAKKIEKQYVDNLLATYFQQSKIDSQLIQATLQIYNQLAELLGRIDQNMDQVIVPSQLSLEKNKFLRQLHQLMLNRNSKLNQNRLIIHNQHLVQNLEKNRNYWRVYRNNLQNLVVFLDQVEKIILKVKSSFEIKQQLIYKLLNDICSSISSLFRTDLIHNLMKSFDTLYKTSIIIKHLRQKLEKKKQIMGKMERQCIQHYKKISSQNYERFQNFHHCAANNKRFFQQQYKNEKSITRNLINCFKQFLQQSYKLVKQRRRFFYQQCKVQTFESCQISYFLTKLIINDNDDILTNGSTLSTKNNSQLSRRSEKKQLAPKINMAQKISKIEQFLHGIKTFDSGVISEDQKYFSCALGPKLLLHGKLYVLPQGLFFDSHFNKKNLLFGKTKLFIPKQQIIQIDMKNTLKVFPDAVLIKTQRGLVSFHALGQRKNISNAIKQAYLGIEKNADDCEEIVDNGNDFKPFNQDKKPPQSICQKWCQPFQNIISQVTLKGSKVRRMFRRYFSDDPFQINNQKYNSFKTYCMTLIEAKNPQSTTISPVPPSYFAYKNQSGEQNHYPESSTRTHTYGKSLPKIPFLSKGGDGKCQQKQIFHWLGPDLFVIEILSTVKGFPLTESMQIWIKYVVRQLSDGVKLTISCQVRFLKQSSTNGLVKNPTISNLKESIQKIVGTIQKCQRSQKVGNKMHNSCEDLSIHENTHQLNQLTKENSRKQIQLSKKQIQLIVAGIIIFYIISMFIVKIF